MKPTFLSQTSDDFFNATGRNLGVMYVYDKGPWFAGVSAYASSKSLTEYANTQGKISVGGSEDLYGVLSITLMKWYR